MLAPWLAISVVRLGHSSLGSRTYLVSLPIQLLLRLRFQLVRGQRRELQAWVLLLEDDGMHSVHRSIIIAAREELLALDSTGDNVANQGILLGQVSGEIHFLPLEPLPDSEARESKV